jgi:deoxyribonuclease-4
MKEPKIGAHISISGGLYKSVERGILIGIECMQIFASSPRKYDIFLPKEEEIKIYKKKLLESSISSVFIHANYLINLASEDKTILEKSLKSLKETLLFASKIKAEGVVYHPGSPKGENKEAAIEREIKSVLEVLKETPEETFLLLENTAGKKKIGTNPTEIGYIFKKIQSKRVKVCIDTAHSFESGNIVSFTKENIKNWLSWWDKEVGLNNIFLFHINDSKTVASSLSDRHANIGEGHIGKDGFENLMSFNKIKKIPWILEVPGFDEKGPDKKNVDILKKIRK